jgi:hypothetical protein
LRASDPSCFNDPYDCKPAFGEDILDQPGAVDAWAGLIRAMMGSDPDLGELKKLEAAVEGLRHDPKLRNFAAMRFNSSVLKATLTHRIVCLAKNPLNPLLWAHYGDAHRGMCVEFDTTKLPFANALGVQYADQFPQLDLANSAPEDFVRIALLTKAKCWEYEGEFRLIACEIEGSAHTRCSKDLIDIPADSVTAVVLGHKCPPERVDEARYLLQRFAPHVKLGWLIRIQARYELAHLPIDLGRSVFEQFGPGAK